MDKVESFYHECCAGCDEPPDPAIKAVLKVLGNDLFVTFRSLIVLCRPHLLLIRVQLTFLVYSLHSLLHRFSPMFLGAAEVGVSCM